MALSARSARALPLLLLGVLLIPGCAWFRVLARPEPEVRPEPWELVCFWVDCGTPTEDSPPGPRDAGREWGEDPNQRRIALAGRLEDGFLQVDEVSAWTAERGHAPLGVEGSAATLERACRETLSRRVPGPGVEIDRIAAARRGEGVAVPISFAKRGEGGPEGTVKRLVVFGDSLSDPGNLKKRLKIFPASPYYLGRFSDGPNWVEHFSATTGVPAYNHAVGGAVSVEHPDIPAAGIISAIQQGAQYLLTGSVRESVGHYLELDLVDGQVQRTNDTVFVVWSGGNDYLSKEPISGDVETMLDSPDSASGYPRIVEQTIAGIADQVRRLHAAGGRRFVVLNLPDLGRIPGVLHNESYRKDAEIDDVARRTQLSRRLSALSRRHNRDLRAEVEKLRRELPGTKILLTDAAGSFDRLRWQRAPDSWRRFDYGFDLAAQRSRELRDRRGVVQIQDRCYQGGYLGTSDPTKVCTARDRTFFWDSVHPTSYLHCWMAYFVERDLAEAGLMPPVRDPRDQRDYCEARRRPREG